MRKKNKILIVGQTPPPYGGQAIMIEKILNFQYEDISFYHVNMNFSTDMNDIGRIQIRKLFELVRVIAGIYKYRIFHNVKILYYPPAGPNTVPIVRDIIILLATRFLFKRTIFHFHAGGLSEKFSDLQPTIQWAFKKVYLYPDLTIRTSELNPDDGKFIHSKNDIIVPYGIDEPKEMSGLRVSKQNEDLFILYAGVLKESKGVNVLIEAIDLLVRQGFKNVIVSLMGKFESFAYEQQITGIIREKKLEKHFRILGVKTGDEKLSFFKQCDIFCFPSYFESETFGIVLLEAMQFSKPIVATKWRGIPDVVKNEENGLLVEIKDPEMLSLALIRLINDSNLRRKFGENGLNIFRKHFTSTIFEQNFYKAIQHCIQ